MRHSLPLIPQAFCILAALLLSTGSMALGLELSLPFGSKTDQVGFQNATTNPDQEMLVPLGPLSFRCHRQEIWVADSVKGRLLLLSSDGAIQKTLAVLPATDGPLVDFAIHQAPNGDIISFWVLAQGSQRVVQVSPTGEVVHSFGGRGPEAGKFLQLNRIEINASGTLFIGDKLKQNIACFSVDGQFLRERHWEWSGFCLTPAGYFCRLTWDETLKVNHLLIEDHDGVVKTSKALDLPPHRNPKLWAVDQQGQALVSYIPAEGFKGSYGIRLCDSAGKPVKTSTMTPPLVMNRFLDTAPDGTLILGTGDFSKAPDGFFGLTSWKWH
jgi:hypothetical protein